MPLRSRPVNLDALPVERNDSACIDTSQERKRSENDSTVNKAGSWFVEKVPVADPGFTWERVLKCQCLAENKYFMHPESPEKDHFTYAAFETLMKARAMTLENSAMTPKCDALNTIYEALHCVDTDSLESQGAAKHLDKVFRLEYITYGQLVPTEQPPIHVRPPPANRIEYEPDEHFESYKYTRSAIKPNRNRSKIIETYVQAPAALGGKHYELTSMRAWPFKTTIMFAVDVSCINRMDCMYGVEFSCAYITSQMKYALTGHETTRRAMGVRLRVGSYSPLSLKLKPHSFMTDGGENHHSLCVSSKTLVEKLFFQRNWPLPKNPTPNRELVEHENGDGEYDDDEEENGNKAKPRYNFIVDDDCLCIVNSFGNNKNQLTETLTKLSNFHIVTILNVYQFTRGSHAPYHKVLCRHRLDDRTGTGNHYLSIDNVDRSPHLEGVKYLDVEVLLDMSSIRTTADLRGVFKTHHSHLDTGVMTVDHISAYMLSFKLPLPDSVITQFGRQENDIFVAGNCAFGKGEIFTHADAKFAIVPKFFANQTNAIERNDFPRHIIIPYAHVRYAMGVRLWMDTMPRFFRNNLVAARATFCMGIMGLHASKIWGGQTGFGHGMPFAWVFSTEPNTGKTEAAVLAQCMLGFYNSGAFTGDSTKPAIIERLSLQRDLTLVVDDVISGSNGESRAYATLGRTLYDQSTRTVCARTHRPYSSAIFTSNKTLNDADKAFQSRMILINFDALEEPRAARNETVSQQELHEARDACLTSEWNCVRELMSALTVDFESMLVDGKLDKHAIQDCAAFMQIAIGRYRDRNANLWGLLLYYMLLTNYMFQCDATDQEAVFEWMINSVTRAAAEYTNHAGLVDQFVLAVDKVRADKASGFANPLGPMDQTLSWDKMRTDLQPKNAQGPHSTTAFIALRIDATCTIIKKVLNLDFKPSLLQHAFDKLDWCVRGHGQFYNTTTQPWPIAQSQYVNGAYVNVPVPESQLTDDMLKEYKCVYFRIDKWNNIVNAVERSMHNPVKYKNIEVFSRCPKVGRYKLFDAACGYDEKGDWFGYRALTQSTFAKFCGARNHLYVGNHVDGGMEVKPEISVLNDAMGFGSIANLYTPQTMCAYFNYNWPDEDEIPPAYKRIPFRSRDGPEDDPIEDDKDIVLLPETPPPSLPPSDDEAEEGERPRTMAETLRAMARRAAKEPEPNASTPTPQCETRSPLGDITNDKNTERADEPTPTRVTSVANKNRKRRRPINLIEDEAEDEDGDDNEEQVAPEQPGEFDWIVPDGGSDLDSDSDSLTVASEEETDAPSKHVYVPGKCINTIDYNSDEGEILCGAECNPAEQLCHGCRMNMTFN